MKTIFLWNDESGSPKPRLQNVAASKVTQRPSEGRPDCSCDRWGHPYLDCVEHNVQVQPNQIEALTAGLQKVSAQLELDKTAPQTVLHNQ